MNSKEPKIEPCGTPLIISSQLEDVPWLIVSDDMQTDEFDNPCHSNSSVYYSMTAVAPWICGYLQMICGHDVNHLKV